MNRGSIGYVIETIECEGFDYAFTGYSNFEEVQDEEFHRLRKEYLQARMNLANYIGCDPDC